MTIKNKFTPAPWKATYSTVSAKDGVLLACTSGSARRNNTEEDYATAKLIASAPELLEALEYLMEDLKLMDMPTKSVQQCLKAIKKARGE